MEEKIFTTTDGHKFRRHIDYTVWQSALDFNKHLVSKVSLDSDYGLGWARVKINNKEEAGVALRYLYYMKEFPFKEVIKLDRYDFPKYLFFSTEKKLVKITECGE